VEASRKQVGIIFGRLFGTGDELLTEEFRVVKQEQNTLNEQGNPAVLKRYTFSIIARTTPNPGANPA